MFWRICWRILLGRARKVAFLGVVGVVEIVVCAVGKDGRPGYDDVGFLNAVMRGWFEDATFPGLVPVFALLAPFGVCGTPVLDSSQFRLAIVRFCARR